jgi:hypothetical protein
MAEDEAKLLESRALLANRALQEAEAERRFGRNVLIVIPAGTVVGAMIVGSMTNVGTALLVLAGGTLLGVVALFWASLRTLSGDAPLPEDLEEAALRRAPLDELRSRKRMFLRALKDLENERALGKMDDADFEMISQRNRAEIKRVMRELDDLVGPHRKRAEDMAKEYLDDVRRTEPHPGGYRDSLGTKAVKKAPKEEEEPRAANPARETCASCNTSNEADAKFCKSCGATLGVTAS